VSGVGLPEYLQQLANNLVSVNRLLSVYVLLRLDVDELTSGVKCAIFG
jgi:hypothetical protein